MNYFMNEHQYTADVIAESVIAWRRKKFIIGYMCIPVMVIFVLLCSIVSGHFIPKILALEVVPLFLSVQYIRAEKTSVKAERERIEVFFGSTAPVYRVEIGEDVRMISTRNDSHVSFSDVENMVETKNLIVLMIKGSMTVPLHKNGFLEGNADECKRYLKEKISKYKGK